MTFSCKLELDAIFLLVGCLSRFRESLSQSELLGKIHSYESFHTQEKLPPTHTHIPTQLDRLNCVYLWDRNPSVFFFLHRIVFNARKIFSIKFDLHDNIKLVESVSGMWLVLLYCLDNAVLSTENWYCV